MAEQRKIVTTTPENSETPLETVRGWVTPTRLFFVRNHFPVPDMDAATWRLTVEGAVGRRGGVDVGRHCSGCRSAPCSLPSSARATAGRF